MFWVYLYRYLYRFLRQLVPVRFSEPKQDALHLDLALDEQL